MQYSALGSCYTTRLCEIYWLYHIINIKKWAWQDTRGANTAKAATEAILLIKVLSLRLFVSTRRFLMWLFLSDSSCDCCSDSNEHRHPQLSHLTDVTRSHTERSWETSIYHKPSVQQHACITQLCKTTAHLEKPEDDRLSLLQKCVDKQDSVLHNQAWLPKYKIN